MAKNGNLPKIHLKSKPDDTEYMENKEAQKLKNQSESILYHGNKDKSMIPSFDFENNNNDYGKGFYTTPDKELGKEWAYSKYTEGEQGYLFTYKFNIQGLNILDLTEYDSLHWVAELLNHRNINTNGREALQDTIDEVKAKYKLDTSGYDVIIGYRADDSYFTYATDFVSGTIYRETLEKALRSGNLGLQVFIKSKEAFDRLYRISEPEPVNPKYRELFLKRDGNARAEYKSNKKYDKTSKDKQRVFDFL